MAMLQGEQWASIFTLILSVTYVQSACPTDPNMIRPVSVTETENTIGRLIYGPVENITNLALKTNPQNFLSVNNTSSANFSVFATKNVDCEENLWSQFQGSSSGFQIPASFTCQDIGQTQEYMYELTIAVQCVDEFAPQFNQTAYNAVVSENSPNGTIVYSFKGRATDPDRDPSSKILYSISSLTPTPFIINNTVEGTIVVSGTLDFESTTKTYLLTVTAKELSDAQKANTTTLTITVTDQDDLGPVFNSSNYTLSIDEGTYNSVVLNTIPPMAAHDGDTLGAQIAFTLDSSSNSLSSLFNVLPNGSMQLTGSLVPGLRTLNIRAYQVDKPLERYTVVSVEVTVNDINNHKPVMDRDNYQATVLENAAVGTVVLVVGATDLDKGVNSSFAFLINESNMPFSVTTNKGLGFITVNGQLDREKNASYVFHVYAQEDQSMEHYGSDNRSAVTITVLDVNDNTPLFASQRYIFTLNQTALLGQFVGQVSAKDADVGENGVVMYAITSADGAPSAFNIGLTTGDISLSRNLTLADVGVAYLEVRASDNATGDDKRSSTARVSVTIQKVQKFSPVFDRPGYNFTVPETAPVDFSLGLISATDGDNDLLQYTLQQPGSAFRLQGNPPSLLVNRPLDHDGPGATSEYRLSVVVSDGSLAPQTTPVIVSVLPVNEFSPVFNLTIYKLSLNETRSSGPVLQVSAWDADGGADGQIAYSLENADQTPFVVNSSSGTISLSCSSGPCLDYSAQRQYTLVVKAQDGGNPPKSSFSTVIISVVNQNTKAPRFLSTSLTSQVYESAPLNTFLLQLQAIDEDTPLASLTFWLQNVVPAEALALSDVTKLVTNVKLDAEAFQHITGTAVVSDGAHNATAVINITVLDINDNFPQITIKGGNMINLLENATVESHVTTAEATDRDVTHSADFRFFLEQGSAKEFSIQQTTGEITVAAPFDRTVQRDYNLTVTVSDNGTPPLQNSTLVRIVITDSNTAPYFVDSGNKTTTQYIFMITETASPGAVLGRVIARDPDSGSSGKVHYAIQNGNLASQFALDTNTGEISLKTRLDYETQQNYSLVVVAADTSYEPKSATATVWVSVVDVVEVPQWPESLPAVTMRLTNLCSNVQLQARSQDVVRASSSGSPSGVVYSLLNNTQFFNIDNVTGQLQTSGDIPASTYYIGLRACSAINSTVCSDALLTIHVTADNVLAFCPPFYTVHVNESAGLGHVVMDLNTTVGDAGIAYTLLDALLPFNVSGTGVVTVSGILDRETESRYTLEVKAVNRTSSENATAQVTVVIDDAPDTAPVFLQPLYTGQVSEDARVGSPVTVLQFQTPLRVAAVDRDLNPTLTYSIDAKNDSSNGSFAVNPTKGEITLARQVDLENMAAALDGWYTFQVFVADGYNSSTTVVKVKVVNANDNSPFFIPNVINLNFSENAQPYYSSATLAATDLDAEDKGRLTYFMTSTQPDTAVPFVLMSNGALYVNGSLDRETRDSYTFIVTATDPGGRNGTATLNITVLDVNEAPVFPNATYNFAVVEGPNGIGSNITITAFDYDLDKNADFTFEILDLAKHTEFAINTSRNSKGQGTGLFFLAKELDRETTPLVTLTVVAIDSGNPPLSATCVVNVAVQDVNDNSPTFASSGYTAQVSENAPNGTQVSLFPSLIVSDGDLGTYGVAGIRYHLQDGLYPPAPFKVDPVTARILVNLYNSSVALDRETTSSYNLTLVAVDNNGTGLSGTTTVLVTLTDVNDQPPQFLQPRYHFSVAENAALTTLLGAVNATDRDGEESLLRFYVNPPAGGDGKFYLHPVTGELRVAGWLDREELDHYVFNIGVFDGLFWGDATVNVTVEDVNDNSPVFMGIVDPLTLHVSENADPQVIYQFNVTDRDSGPAGVVSLFMNDTGNAAYFLYLTPNGRLSTITNRSLDREKYDQVSLTFRVWATDSGTPPRVTSVLVTVLVTGANENAPRVCQIMMSVYPVCGQDIRIQAFNGEKKGTFLAALKWEDSDQGEGSVASLAVSEDPEGLLALNVSTTGTFSFLTLALDVDRQRLRDRGRLGLNNATYRAAVTATDQGSPPLNSSQAVLLTVLETPLTVLAFSETVYSFAVPENAGPAVIGSVNATVAGQTSQTVRVNYTLQAQPDFTVDVQGRISTSRSLDRETADHYAFLVLAWDSATPSSTATAAVLVTVLDTNDNSPRFSSPLYDVTVAENQAPGKVLTTLVAVDLDVGANGNVTYSLFNSSLSETFRIEEYSGRLLLLQGLDRERQASYTLDVLASDGGTPAKTATATVHVRVLDVNDNPPTFSRSGYNAVLDVASPPATLVASVSATDADEGLNGYVLYSLTPDPSFVMAGVASFFINEFSGAIYTARTLTYQGEQHLNLSVVGRDLGTPSRSSTALVAVLVNDLAAVLPHVTFYPPTVALVLGTQALTPVPVNVSAGQGSYNFSIAGGNSERLFDIISSTGHLFVARKLSRTGQYQLVIRAVNNDKPEYHSSSTLTVMVTTVLLEQERYAAVVPENTDPGHLLLDINSNAEKLGVPVIYSLSNNYPGCFLLNENTGQLYSNRSLDRELVSQYTLTIRVTLQYDPSLRHRRDLTNVATVVIIVEDTNDNPPRFTLTSRVFGIASNAPAGTVVIALQADDSDDGVNGELRYGALRGDTANFFVTVDGEVTSRVAMTGANKEFSLTVYATDMNGLGNSTTADIKIVTVPHSDRFGLVANITVAAFMDAKDHYLGNLSRILNLTLVLDKAVAHTGSVLDTTKSDIYFFAFNAKDQPVPFSVINQRVSDNTAAINALFAGARLLQVTDTPVVLRVQTAYRMGEAEIAVIVVACVLFLACFVAILITIRAWKKQKALQKREEAAARAREILDQETKELADKMKESSFVADPEEPLELEAQQQTAAEEQRCRAERDDGGQDDDDQDDDQEGQASLPQPGDTPGPQPAVRQTASESNSVVGKPPLEDGPGAEGWRVKAPDVRVTDAVLTAREPPPATYYGKEADSQPQDEPDPNYDYPQSPALLGAAEESSGSTAREVSGRAAGEEVSGSGLSLLTSSASDAQDVHGADSSATATNALVESEQFGSLMGEATTAREARESLGCGPTHSSRYHQKRHVTIAAPAASYYASANEDTAM